MCRYIKLMTRMCVNLFTHRQLLVSVFVNLFSVWILAIKQLYKSFSVAIPLCGTRKS